MSTAFDEEIQPDAGDRHSPAQEDLMLIRQARKLSSGPTASSGDDRTESDCP
jgi:hypothetical protein